MNLRLRGPGTNSAPGDEVSGVLRCNRIKEFASCRETHFCDVEEKGTCYPETLVDLEGPVHGRIIDQSFPTNSGSRLFEVDSHNDVQIIFGLFRIGSE